MVMNSIDPKAIPWNSDTVYALGLYRTLGRILGIWPLSQNNLTSTIQVVIYSTLQLLVMIVFIQKLITVGNCSITKDLVDALTLVGTSILSVMKIVIPLIYKNSMFSIVNSAVEDWHNISDDKSRKIMLKYAFIGRLVFIIQITGAYITIIPLIFGNLPSLSTINVDDHVQNISNIIYRNIPVGPNCWVSPTTSSILYLVFYCFITTHLIILCTAYVGGDVYIFGIAMHVCGQLEVLYHNMETLDGNCDYLTLRKKINQNSRRHCYLLDLSNKFEESFNLVILFQVAATTFIIGITGILLLWALKTGDGTIVVSFSVRMYVLYLQLFIYSYIGESLSQHTEKLQVAIYNCKWYKMPPMLMKDLSFIMMRNNYPFHLTAGKIYDMNISNFKNLVKTMFSYFSVLRLMFDT